MRFENGTEERRQLCGVLFDQRDDVNDTNRRGVRREFDGFGGVLVVDVKAERRKYILDDGEIRAPAGVENDVEGLETRSLEPGPCRGESGGSGGVQSNELGIDTKLTGEYLDLSLGRDGIEGRSSQRLGDLYSGASNTYNCVLSTY